MVQKAASKIPIIKQPIKLATSVPNASELNRELSHRPNPQRKEAPIAAPALTRKIDWNIYLIPKISAKCLATASSLLNPISSSSGQASFKRESAFAIT